MAWRKINDTKLSAIADAVRERLHTTVQMTPDDMPQLVQDIGIGYVPDYWREYLNTKAAQINAALNAAGDNRSAFLWYTDAHWTTNYGQSPMILKYLSRHTGMAKTFFGGDIAQAESGEIDALRAWQALVADVPDHHSVLGNHDNKVSDLPVGPSEFFLAPERTGDVVYGTDATNGKNYYYIDNHIEKTRYICLSTGRMWTYADEVQWCVDALGSTPNGWHIVVISHLWLDNNYDVSPVVPLETPERYTQVFLDLFDAYNYRESGTTDFASTAYDFTTAAAKVEFVIGGHVHQDLDFTTAKGIPVILTECDGYWERDADSVATQGTITENCVYAVVADYTAKTVKIINVGRGASRNVAIPDVVMYTNQIKKSVASDGTPYNGGKGYKENYRLNSAGAENAYNGRCITGFIPVRTGDVVRFKDLDYMNMSATSDDGTIKIVVYNEGFGYVNNAGHSPNNLPSAAWSPVYREDGNVKQVTIPTAYGSSVRYMRISAKNINDDSVITVNEEID